MSTETTPQNKTFLTRAMENVRAKQNGEVSDENPESPLIAETKRFQKKALVITVGATVVLAAAWKLLSKLPDVDEESAEENTSED